MSCPSGWCVLPKEQRSPERSMKRTLTSAGPARITSLPNGWPSSRTASDLDAVVCALQTFARSGELYGDCVASDGRRVRYTVYLGVDAGEPTTLLAVGGEGCIGAVTFPHS